MDGRRFYEMLNNAGCAGRTQGSERRIGCSRSPVEHLLPT